jgi:hypothetical protein
MYQDVNFCQFCDAFRNMGRDTQFSYEAKRALYDYLTDLEADMGEPIELDVIALCCEYQEIEDTEDCYRDYVGDEASREEFIIANLESSVLVREG